MEKICKRTLEYVVGSKHDDIFRELHNSPIGGHKGFQKSSIKSVRITIGRA